jgi:hypothetical protein
MQCCCTNCTRNVQRYRGGVTVTIRDRDCLLNQLGIQAHEAKFLVVLTTVSSLGQLTVAAQVGEVDFATYQ